jgi:mannose-6-phosphate isomerase-like protein (cupin superfamily)
VHDGRFIHDLRVTARRATPQESPLSWWIWLVLGLAVGGVATGAGAQSPGVVDVTQEPSHHLVLSNDYVKVLDVTVAAHATTLVHRHVDDYFFITLGTADITNSRLGGLRVQMALKDGAINFAAGGFAHSVTVTGNEPLHNITVAFVHPATHVVYCDSACAKPVPCLMGMACASVNRALESDQWTIDSVTIPPQAELAGVASAGHPVLVIGVSPVQLTRGRPSTGESLVRGGPGKFVWLTGAEEEGADGRVSIGNAGAQPARLVVVRWAALGAARE